MYNDPNNEKERYSDREGGELTQRPKLPEKK